MIIIDNREMLIPATERYIGTIADENCENRCFRIPRISQGGQDLSDLTYRIDYRYPDERTAYYVNAVGTGALAGKVLVRSETFLRKKQVGSHVFTYSASGWTLTGVTGYVNLADYGIVTTAAPASGNQITVTVTAGTAEGDTALMDKELTDDYIYLTWNLTSQAMAVPGTMFANIRGSNNDGEVRYASFPGVFYVENGSLTPTMSAEGLTELEQMENLIAEALRKVDLTYARYEDLQAAIQSAEAWAIGTRGGQPVAPTDDTYKNNAKHYAFDAEAWDKGTRGGVEVMEGDPAYHNNAKYYSLKAINDTTTQMLLSEAWAVGEMAGTPVTETAEQYHNNSKYYAQQAAAAATTAASAAAEEAAEDVYSMYGEAFVPRSTYRRGDLVIYEGKLYRCNKAIIIAQTFVPEDWDEINLAVFLQNMSDNIDLLAPDFSVGETYRSGDIVLHEGKLFTLVRSTGDYIPAEWDEGMWEELLVSDIGSMLNAVVTNFVPVYVADLAYNVGDLALYAGKIYRAKQAHSGHLPTDALYWDVAEPSDLLMSLNLRDLREQIDAVNTHYNELSLKDSIEAGDYYIKNLVTGLQQEYSETGAYGEGSYVIYNDQIWRALASTPYPAGAFDETIWKPCGSLLEITDEIKQSHIAPIYTFRSTYAVGDYCIYPRNGTDWLWRCVTAVNTPEPFDASKWETVSITSVLKELEAAVGPEGTGYLPADGGDAKDLTATFTSSDTTDTSQLTTLETVPLFTSIVSGVRNRMSTLLEILSKTVKNVRILAKKSFTGVTVSGQDLTFTSETGDSVTVRTQDTNTWTPNSTTEAGYVPAPTASGGNSFYSTNASGVPAWRDNITASHNANGLMSADNYRTLLNYTSDGARDTSHATRFWATDANGTAAWRYDSSINAAYNRNGLFSMTSYRDLYNMTSEGVKNTDRANMFWATDTNGNATWRRTPVMGAATSTADGRAGLAPAPTSANYADRNLMLLRSSGTWGYIPTQNNDTTSVEHYALDARMGKTLSNRITSVETRTTAIEGNDHYTHSIMSNVTNCTFRRFSWTITSLTNSLATYDLSDEFSSIFWAMAWVANTSSTYTVTATAWNSSTQVVTARVHKRSGMNTNLTETGISVGTSIIVCGVAK